MKANFKIFGLTAKSNIKLLAKQACKYKPKYLVVEKESDIKKLKSLCGNYAVFQGVHARREALLDSFMMKKNQMFCNTMIIISFLHGCMPVYLCKMLANMIEIVHLFHISLLMCSQPAQQCGKYAVLPGI